VIVTGLSSEIGLITAWEVARADARVAVRNVGRGEAALAQIGGRAQHPLISGSSPLSHRRDGRAARGAPGDG
jgi:NAD(P)-dependent dehydrogenase (short-subunit alcohol dehydrogenase family)